MAINRFFKPVEYSYTPIPFELLMVVGKELNRQRELAEAELNTNIRQFGKFVSPSAIDMENYNKESIGKLAPFIEQAAANPEVMKDAAWRAQMQNQLNNIDYAKLGMLEQSAANLTTRLQNIAKLKAAGKYNANWDDVDISNWDTLNSEYGIMNSLAPIEYETLELFGTPFADKIKPTFYKGVDPNNPKNKMLYTNWMSITRDDIARQFAQHVSDIKKDPKGAMHYRDITSEYLKQHPNATQQELDNVFIDALTTRQSDKIISTPVIDQVSLKLALNKYANSPKKPDSTQQYITPREQLSNQYQSNFNDYVERNLTDPTRKDYQVDQKYQQYAQKGAMREIALANEIEKAGGSPHLVELHRFNAIQYAQDAANAQLRVNRKEFSNMYGSNKIGPEDFDDFNKSIDVGKFEKVSKDFIDNMGGEITLTDSYDMLKHIANPTKVLWSGGETDGFTLNSSADFVLPSTLASNILLIQGDNPIASDRFIQALLTGAYKNVQIIPHKSGTAVADTSAPLQKREYIKATAVIDTLDVDLSIYPWYTILPAMTETVYEWFAGDYALQAVGKLGGKYNSDTDKIELEVYVPIGESNQQAELFNFERNKDRFGTTTNTNDRYDYTNRTNLERLNIGYHGEE